MKKNVFLKLASALLVLCLASTCAIGTTFAKYTTADKASDTARVAKWGITVAVSGTLFGTDYASNTAADDKDSIVATGSENVSSSNTDKIVAPGTKNTAGFQVKLSGQPEVAYQITANTNGVTIEDIWLAKNTYGVMVPVHGVNAATSLTNLYVLDGTTYKPATSYVAGTTYFALHDKVVLDEQYNPIKWSVENTGANSVAIAAGDLMTVTNALVSAMNGKTGNAEDTLEATYTLTWEWLWEVNNGADTILGNLAANPASVVKLVGTNYVAVEASDYNLDIAFGMKVVVDQVN